MAFLTVAAAALTLTTAQASGWSVSTDDDWCSDDSRRGNRFCEVRETTLAAAGTLEVDGRMNGGIGVEGWDRNEVLVRAKVQIWNRDRDTAPPDASSIHISTTGGVIEADGPERAGDQNWAVSYRLMVPRDSDLVLRANNGGISIEDVRGEIRMSTRNGGLHLEDVGGDIEGRTTNGGLHVELAGDSWDGAGLDLETTNGGIHLELSESYSADLVAGTVNGGFEIDFPVQVQGKIGRRLETTLGSGGAPIRVITTNGGVTIEGR
jgi:DUF4097 and DUF4098 domain-containing protein YvlB